MQLHILCPHNLLNNKAKNIERIMGKNITDKSYSIGAGLRAKGTGAGRLAGFASKPLPANSGMTNRVSPVPIVACMG